MFKFIARHTFKALRFGTSIEDFLFRRFPAADGVFFRDPPRLVFPPPPPLLFLPDPLVPLLCGMEFLVHVEREVLHKIYGNQMLIQMWFLHAHVPPVIVLCYIFA